MTDAGCLGNDCQSLPFDKAYAPKSAFFEMLAVLNAAPLPADDAAPLAAPANAVLLVAPANDAAQPAPASAPASAAGELEESGAKG
jgi:hypothetical protein